MNKIFFSIFVVVAFISCKNDKTSSEESQRSDLILEDDKNSVLSSAEAIAFKNGFENWNQVSEIQFTFNVDRDVNHSERTWIWKPKTNDVIMMTLADTVSYNRTNMDSIVKKTDAAFINDKYWLLAPFNLLWDKGTTISEKQNIVAPISKDTLDQITLTYGNEGGYTPGDAYDFYFGKDFIIKEWVYRQGNDTVPSMMTTWEDYETFNGLNIAKMHKIPDADFKLYFTNISVK